MDDDPLSSLNTLIGQLRQHDKNFVPNDYIYKHMFTVDDNIAGWER